MTKKEELITALVANTKCKLEKATLEKLEEKELQVLTEQMVDTPEGQPTEPATPATPAQPAPAEEEAPAWAKTLIQDVSELKTKIQANADQEKAGLVEELAANQQALPKEALEKLSIEQLRQYRQHFVPADYSGRGLPVVNRGGGDNDWEDYELPELATPGQNGGGN